MGAMHLFLRTVLSRTKSMYTYFENKNIKAFQHGIKQYMYNHIQKPGKKMKELKNESRDRIDVVIE
jgi:hypothetical protein